MTESMKVAQPKRYRWSTIVTIFLLAVLATLTLLGPPALTLLYQMAGPR